MKTGLCAIGSLEQHPRPLCQALQSKSRALARVLVLVLVLAQVQEVECSVPWCRLRHSPNRVSTARRCGLDGLERWWVMGSESTSREVSTSTARIEPPGAHPAHAQLQCFRSVLASVRQAKTCVVHAHKLRSPLFNYPLLLFNTYYHFLPSVADPRCSLVSTGVDGCTTAGPSSLHSPCPSPNQAFAASERSATPCCCCRRRSCARATRRRSLGLRK